MDGKEQDRLQAVLCKQFGVQAGPHTLAYVQSKLNDPQPFAILGTNSRNGVPVQAQIDPALLVQALQQSGDAVS